MPTLKPEGVEEQYRQRKQHMQRPCAGSEHVQGGFEKAAVAGVHRAKEMTKTRGEQRETMQGLLGHV